MLNVCWGFCDSWKSCSSRSSSLMLSPLQDDQRIRKWCYAGEGLVALSRNATRRAPAGCMGPGPLQLQCLYIGGRFAPPHTQYVVVCMQAEYTPSTSTSKGACTVVQVSPLRRANKRRIQGNLLPPVTPGLRLTNLSEVSVVHAFASARN